MPSISPVIRASIGSNPQDFKQPRATVTAPTGMGLPSLAKSMEQIGENPPKVEKSPQTGQPDIKEDTTAPAVTLSPQLTALARKQQILQREIQAQREKEAQFEATKADYVPRSSFKAKLQENAMEALNELGVNYEELTNLLLNQQQSADPVKKLEAEIQNLKTAQEQSVSKQYEATVNQYKSEIQSLIEKNPEFITVKEEKAQEVVLQHILDTFEKDGKILSVEDASKDIEDFLVEEAEGKLKLTKLKAKLSPPVETPQKQTLPPPRSGARTLTQSVESAPTRTYNQMQHMTPKERLAAALARAQK